MPGISTSVGFMEYEDNGSFDHLGYFLDIGRGIRLARTGDTIPLLVK